MISQESLEFWRKGRKNPQFGAPGNEFYLDGLRQGIHEKIAVAYGCRFSLGDLGDLSEAGERISPFFLSTNGNYALGGMKSKIPIS